MDPSEPNEAGKANRRNHIRYPFVARAEIEEIPSGGRVFARVTEIGAGGCYLDTLNSLPKGTLVFVKIFTASDFFEHLQPWCTHNRTLGLDCHFKPSAEISSRHCTDGY